MKRWIVTALLAVAAAGCDMTFDNPHLGVRGLTEEDLKAPPGKNQIRGAVINDIRERRTLQLRLDEGGTEVPSQIRLDKYGIAAVRAKDGVELWRIEVKADPVDQVHAVTEVAYWDNDAGTYIYHYEGGSPHRDVWFGPFKITFPKPPTDEP
jgi:hypothetical protein